MARQLYCRGLLKNLLRSDGQQRNYSYAKFPSNLNCGHKTVSETGPSSRPSLTTETFWVSTSMLSAEKRFMTDVTSLTPISYLSMFRVRPVWLSLLRNSWKHALPSSDHELWYFLICLLHHVHLWWYSERPRGAGFRSVNPAERWRENPARALARAGFSQHLECGIHRSESSPEGSFALIPHPVARWTKTTP